MSEADSNMGSLAPKSVRSAMTLPFLSVGNCITSHPSGLYSSLVVVLLALPFLAYPFFFFFKLGFLMVASSNEGHHIFLSTFCERKRSKLYLLAFVQFPLLL